MTRMLSCSLILVILAFSVSAAEDKADDAAKEKADHPAALDFKMETLDGKKVHLAEKYGGKVVLLVNVASECGLTPQYKQLQALHEKYGKKGLAIVGVPCNQFGGQEPGSAKEIRAFCTREYGVEFDLLSKVDVNGDDAAPLYKFLTSKKTAGKFAGKISWNFEKFLISRDGQVVARFEPRVAPNQEEVLETIEEELAKKPKKRQDKK